MTGWVVAAGIRFRLLVLVAAAALVAVTLTLIRDTPVDVLPEFSPTYVEVQTEALGLSAAEVEQLITVPLEADLLNGVPWLATIRSDSVPGLSSIVLVFEPGTDPLRARQVVNERITQAKALPNVSAPPVMLEPLSSSSRVLMVALTPRSLSLIDASVLARYTVRPRLMSVPGVANVLLWGQRDRQLQVQVDPRKLAAADVSLQQVVQTAGNAMYVSPLSFLEASSPGAGGFIDTTNQRLGIQHVSPIVSPDTLAQVTVEKTPNRVLRLGEVATVVSDHPPLIGDAAANGASGLLLVVEKFPGADTLDVTRGVEAALEDLRPGLTGLHVDPSVFRPATYVELAASDIGTWLLAGALLAVLAIGLLLFSWRAALVSLVAVLLSVTAAVLALHLLGAGANAMVLAGLVVAVGVLVDDALLDVGRIRRRLAEADTASPADVVETASVEVRSAVRYALAAGALAVLPVFVLAGQQRALYSPLALAYLLATAASTLVALTVTPALSVLLLGPPSLRRSRPVRAESAGLRWLAARYARLLPAVLEHRRPVLAAAVVLLALGVGALPLLGTGRTPLPPLEDPNLLVEFTAPPGTSLPEMDRITAAASRELRAVPGVRDVAAHTGRAVFGDQVVDVNSSELWVSLDPAADHDAALAAVRTAAAGYPGIESQVLTYEQRRTADILGGPTSDITVRVYGQDPEVLAAKAAEVARMLAGVDGVVDPHVEQQPLQPTLVVEVDLGAAQRFSIKPGDVRRASAALLSGIAVGSLYQDQKIFDVVVRGTPMTQRSLSSVRDLLVDTPTGGHVRLGDVAEVRVDSRPTVIKREDVSRRVDVTASVRGRSVAAVSDEVAARLRSIPFPLEHHAELLGDYAARQTALARVLAVSVAAALGIFLLLQGAFGSWRLASVVFLTLPVALTGGVLATLAGGGVVSLGSLAGLLTVLGLALRHSVLFVRHAQRLREEEGQPFGAALVLRAARERLAPVVTTTLTSALVLVPVLVLGHVAGLEIVHPLAVAVLGGLVTSTFLALVVVPALYAGFGALHRAHGGDAIVAD